MFACLTTLKTEGLVLMGLGQDQLITPETRAARALLVAQAMRQELGLLEHSFIVLKVSGWH